MENKYPLHMNTILQEILKYRKYALHQDLTLMDNRQGKIYKLMKSITNLVNFVVSSTK